MWNSPARTSDEVTIWIATQNSHLRLSRKRPKKNTQKIVMKGYKRKEHNNVNAIIIMLACFSIRVLFRLLYVCTFNLCNERTCMVKTIEKIIIGAYNKNDSHQLQSYELSLKIPCWASRWPKFHDTISQKRRLQGLHFECFKESPFTTPCIALLPVHMGSPNHEKKIIVKIWIGLIWTGFWYNASTMWCFF